MRFLLIGNYGTGNLGDEALRDFFLERFSGVQWTVVSARPSSADAVPRIPFGLRSIVATPWWKTLAAMRGCDAVVFGGGSLFTDVESVSACVLWWWHAAVARVFGKPLVLAFQGIGPFRTSCGAWFAKRVVATAAFVSVRDDASAQRATAWARVPVVLSGDPVFRLLQTGKASPSASSILAAIPRRNSGPAFRDALRAAVDTLRPSAVRIVSMQPDDSAEQHVCASLARETGPAATVVPVRTLQALTTGLSGCTRIVSERYHGALAAIAMAIPVDIVAQSEGDKLSELRPFADATGNDRLDERIRAGEGALQKYINMLK